MLKAIGKLFARLSLSALVREIDLDIDTVEKNDGVYLRVRVEAFGRKVIDRMVLVARLEDVARNVSGDSPGEKIWTIREPIDVYDPPGVNLPEWTRKANDRLIKSLNRN